MGDDDMPGPGQPEPRGKTDQEIFDEQIARASGKTVVMFGEQSPRLTSDALGAQLFTLEQARRGGHRLRVGRGVMGNPRR